MTRWALLAAVVALVPVQLLSQAQARPDFSGKWKLATKSVRGPSDPRLQSCSGILVLVPDQSTLRVQSGDAGLGRIYRFDGADTVEALALPAPRDVAKWVGANQQVLNR